ncbi:tandem-95 repeat protein, partial [Methylobacterium oxalidis]
MAKFSYVVTPDSGASAADRYTSGNANHALIISGTGAANDSIIISYIDPVSKATKTLTTKVAKNGLWSITTASLNDGAYNLTVKETGTQPVSAIIPTWFLDTKTNVTITGIGPDTGRSATDGVTKGGTPITISGTAEASATVRVNYVDAKGNKGSLGPVTADASGKWSLKAPVAPDGTYTLTAVATDKAGNTATSTFKGVLDSVAPSAPTLTVKDDKGTVVTNTPDNTLHVSGKAETNSAVVVSWKDAAGNTGTLTPIVAANGTWTVDTGTLAAGKYTFTATATDLAGNVSKASPAFNFTVTGTAPTVALTSQVLANDTGASNTDRITKDGHVQLSGTVAAGATVDIYDGTTKLGTATISGTTWSYSGVLNAGTHDLYARATSASGLTTNSNHGAVITVDTTVTPETFTNVLLAGDNIISATEAAEARVELKGSLSKALAPDEKLFVTLDGQTHQATVTGTTFALSVPTPTASGSLILKVVDTAGNETIPFNQAYTVYVKPSNKAPILASAIADQSSPEDATWSFQVPAGTFTDPDSASLTYTFVAVDSAGVALATQPTWLSFDATSRTFSGQPPLNFNGELNLKVTASDGEFSASDTFKLTVAAVNDKPVAEADTLETAEDTPLTVAAAELVKNDSDVDGNPLSVSEVTQGQHGTVALVNGQITYTPDNNFTGTDTFTYTVTDGQGNESTATATVTVAIGAVNDAPVLASAIADQNSLEDTAWSFQVPAGTFTDADSASLTYSFVAVDAAGVALTTQPTWLSFDATSRTFSGQPPLNFNGELNLKVTASDGEFSASDTFKLTVTAVNDKPVAEADTLETAEDTPLTIQAAQLVANDQDVDSPVSALSVSEVTQGQHGTVALVGGQITYTPDNNFTGTDTFTYTVTDGQGNESTATATVTVTVGAVNDAPVVASAIADQTSPEDAAWSFQIPAGTFTDADSASLTYSSVAVDSAGVALTTQPTWLSFDATSRTFSGQPPLNFNGELNLKVTASDGEFTVSDTFKLTVTAINDKPVAEADALETAEDTPLTVAVAELIQNDSDVDGNALSVSDVSQGQHGTVALVNGQITYTPDTNFTGTDTFTYTVTDGQGNESTATATVTVTIGAINDAPTAAPVTLAPIAEDSGARVITAAELLAGASDLDTPASSLSITTLTLTSSSGSLVNNPDGTWTFTPETNDDTSASFSYTVSDGSLEASSTASLDITPVNDAPLAGTASDDKSGVEDVILTGQLAAGTDPDGDGLTYKLVEGSASHGSVVIDANGSYTFTPEANYSGPATFKYVVHDGSLESVEKTVNLTFAPANDTPVAQNDTATTNEDTPVTIDVLANDNIGANDTDQNLSITKFDQGQHGTVALVGGQITYTPSKDFTGTDTFTYTVTDGQGNESTATATVTVTVGAVNDAPILASAIADQSSPEDAAWSFQVPAGTFTDADSASLTYTFVAVDAAGVALATQPTWLSFDAVNRTFSGQPPQDFNGELNLRVMASDGEFTVSDTFRLTVTAVNDKPVAEADTLETTEDTPLTIQAAQLVVNDQDVDSPASALSVSSVTQASNGTVTLANGQITYRPNKDFFGTDTFTYTVTDGQGNESTATATVTVAVTAVNDAPVLTQPLSAQSGRVGDAFSLVLDAGMFADADGQQPVAYSVSLSGGGDLPGWLHFDPETRTFSGTPSSSDADTYVISIIGTEPDGQKSSTSFTITVVDGSAIEGDAEGIPKDDTLNGTTGGETINGGAGADQLFGGPGADLIRGGSGDDTLYGEAGSDVLDGGADQDQLYGGSGNDVLYGRDGNDGLNGNEGDDRLYGEAGMDNLNGGAGDDLLEGGADDDTLQDTDGGTDTLQGGDGNDSLYARDSNGQVDTLESGAGDDSLSREGYNSYGSTLRAGEGNDYLYLYEYGNNGVANTATLDGGAGNDSISVGQASGDSSDQLQIDAGDGNNTITVNRSYVQTAISAGSGNDVITVNNTYGQTAISAGIGTDIISIAGAYGQTTVTAGLGDDTVTGIGNGGQHNVDAGDGADTLRLNLNSSAS